MFMPRLGTEQDFNSTRNGERSSFPLNGKLMAPHVRRAQSRTYLWINDERAPTRPGFPCGEIRGTAWDAVGSARKLASPAGPVSSSPPRRHPAPVLRNKRYFTVSDSYCFRRAICYTKCLIEIQLQ